VRGLAGELRFMERGTRLFAGLSSMNICPPSAVGLLRRTGVRLSTLRSGATEDGRHLRLEALDFGLWSKSTESGSARSSLLRAEVTQ
jgi:hypothetical protein